MEIPHDQLETQTNEEASDWFREARVILKGEIVDHARNYYRAVQKVGLDGDAAVDAQCLLFMALDAYEDLDASQAPFFAARKAAVKAARAEAAERKRQENLAEGQRLHAEAVEKAFQRNRVTDAVRKERKETLAEGIARAHANPDPLPRPESHIERLVNNQRRSFGSVVHVNTGNIAYRLREKKGRDV